jgi:hypothetical protein
MKKSPASMKKNSAFTLRSGNRVSPMQLSGVQSPMRKEKRKRTVEYTQDSETGDITKTITRKSGATVTKTFKEGERRASKVVRDNKFRTRTVTGKGLDKEIHVQPKNTSGTYNPSKEYKTTPRKNIKRTVKDVVTIGAGIGLAALTKGALSVPAKKAILSAATHGGRGALAVTAGELGKRTVESVKQGVRNIKQNIKEKRQKRRESKVKKA